MTTGAIQGEWTVVYSPDLAQGDMVMGSVTSFIGDDDGGFRGFGGGRPPGGGPPAAAAIVDAYEQNRTLEHRMRRGLRQDARL